MFKPWAIDGNEHNNPMGMYSFTIAWWNVTVYLNSNWSQAENHRATLHVIIRHFDIVFAWHIRYLNAIACNRYPYPISVPRHAITFITILSLIKQCRYAQSNNNKKKIAHIESFFSQNVFSSTRTPILHWTNCTSTHAMICIIINITTIMWIAQNDHIGNCSWAIRCDWGGQW